MVGRGELTDAAREQIRSRLAANVPRGGPWPDDQIDIDDILWKLRTNGWRRDLPERYGS